MQCLFVKFTKHNLPFSMFANVRFCLVSHCRSRGSKPTAELNHTGNNPLLSMKEQIHQNLGHHGPSQNTKLGGRLSGRFMFERIHNTKEQIYFYERAENHKAKERLFESFK